MTWFSQPVRSEQIMLKRAAELLAAASFVALAALLFMPFLAGPVMRPPAVPPAPRLCTRWDGGDACVGITPGRRVAIAAAGALFLLGAVVVHSRRNKR